MSSLATWEIRDMSNGRKTLFAALAAAMSLTAFGPAAAPAAAQTGPGGTYGSCQYDPYWFGWYRNYVTHREPCTPTPSEYFGTCVYDELSGNWYRFYVTHVEPCDPYS